MEKMNRRRRVREVAEKRVGEDNGTVEARKFLNKGTANDASRWPLMRTRVARLGKESVTSLNAARDVARDVASLATWPPRMST